MTKLSKIFNLFKHTKKPFNIFNNLYRRVMNNDSDDTGFVRALEIHGKPWKMFEALEIPGNLWKSPGNLFIRKENLAELY